MESDRCPGCRKEFAWYLLRFRLQCHRCGTEVCPNCLAKNSENELVCPKCHLCTKCRSRTPKHALRSVLDQLLCPECHSAFQGLNSRWIEGTRYESLRGARIVKRLGLIKISTKCNSPAEVETLLKLQTLLAGGNSYVKFFWDKEIEYHEEEYQAGTGPAGNPYYRTRRWTTQHFTGHGEAVLAERIQRSALVDGRPGHESPQHRMGLITTDVAVGQIYEGKVAHVAPYGAFVTILPGKDGLVHISQISNERVERVSDRLKEGDWVRVKVLEIDRQGRIRLSMRDVDAA